jgi:hypothetical protein
MLSKADQDFLNEMVPHHQEALVMSRKVLKDGSDTRIRQLAQSILKGQSAEIKKMMAWGSRPDPGAEDTAGEMNSRRLFHVQKEPEPVHFL